MMKDIQHWLASQLLSHNPQPETFLSGTINGITYTMLCTRSEFEAFRQYLQASSGAPFSDDEVWSAFHAYALLDPWDDWFGPYEPVAPSEAPYDFEERRRRIAANMGLPTDTTTWFQLVRTFDTQPRGGTQSPGRPRSAAPSSASGRTRMEHG